MKLGLTHINLIVDRSGSMRDIADDTIGGINMFLQGQKDQSLGEAFISFYQFDNVYECVYKGVNARQVPLLTKETYVPRGNTALLDAIGKTVVEVGIQMSRLQESERPAKIIIVIVTDGFENASTQYSRDKIFEMITHQKEKYNWDFVFLGANQDAIAVGQSYGVPISSSMSYHASGPGVTGMWLAVSGATCSTRSRALYSCDSVFAGFTTADIALQDNLINKTTSP
jgi:hypothetical protein